jgi:RimK family alpha-L-glutamate ligase
MSDHAPVWRGRVNIRCDAGEGSCGAPSLLARFAAMPIAIVARRPTTTNARIARAGGPAWRLLTPEGALRQLRSGDVALGRLDVRPSLDGIDGSLAALGDLEARGVRVLNPAGVLLAAHDKLVTARLLRGAGLPHPATTVATSAGCRQGSYPVVVKPRFGSWGREVAVCADARELREHLHGRHGKRWFDDQGALVQELVPPRGFDLRLIVAAERVVGAVRRVAAPGEWRTNIALGGRRERVDPPAAAQVLALAAARVTGAHLVGVDLLPTDGGWTILELNGAVEFTPDYSLDRDVFAAVAAELASAATEAGAADSFAQAHVLDAG